MITLVISVPASSKTALIFSKHCLACSAAVPSTIKPVAGLIGICPEQNTKSPTATAWLYGPIAAGALVVEIFLMIL